MSLERTLARHLARQAGIGQQRLEAITPVPGVPAGFLMGRVDLTADYASMGDAVPVDAIREWDVIIHPDVKLFTVRQKGCSDENGLVVQLTEAWVAAAGMKHGTLITNSPPEGVAIVTQAGKAFYALPLKALVIAVLAAPHPADAPALPAPDEGYPDAPQG